MRILLVRPWANKNITSLRNYMFGEPIGIECVSSILKEAGHKVLVVDFMIEEDKTLEYFLELFKPNLVGVTSQCTDVINVLEIAKSTKKYNEEIKVMVGGVQATGFPDCFFDNDVDYIFKATTRSNLRKVIEEIKSNSFNEIEGVYSKKLNFKNNLAFCKNEYVKADRNSTKRYRKHYKYIGYQPCAVLQTSYGCKNVCTFCVRWRLEGSKVIEIPIEDIVQEISELDEKYIMITDNDFLANKKRLIQFIKLLKQRGIKKEYICYGSVNNVLKSRNIVKQLREVGLVSVIMGYESFNDEHLSSYSNKNSTKENIIATRILQKAGIACWGSFIIHPDWNKKDFKTLRKYIRVLKPELLSFSPLVPHPLTDLYDQYFDRLIYKKEDYEKWNFGDVLIYPSKMKLSQYYFQVLILFFTVNGLHSLKYSLKTFPKSNVVRMLFGFDSMLKVYIKNYIQALKTERGK